MSAKVRVRFPPSPTGPMHIGTARAMLFNYLFAKKNDGQIVFRSEDTDRQRSTRESEQEILDGIFWLGLSFDEGVHRQSERYEIYEQYFEQLKKSGAIYPCYCTAEELEKEREEQQAAKKAPRYSGHCRELSAEEIAKFEAEGREPVWRFRVPEQEISFTDLVRGEVREHSREIADFVVRKADEQFLYHFVVVVDDTEMGITHVIRGEDHISNTFKHILLFQALGADLPEFAHLPLLLNADRSKMSKRDDSGRPMTVERLKTDGYLPVAVTNYLATLGWNPGDEREFFTLAELQKEFSIERVQKSGAIFDLERLKFFNAHHLAALPLAEKIEQIRPFCSFEITDEELLAKAVEVTGDRLRYFGEADELLSFFFALPEYDAAELFPHKKMKVEAADALTALEAALPVLEKIENWETDEIQEKLIAKVGELGWKNGKLLWPVRVALTGVKFSPGVWEMASTLGKDETLARIQTGIDKLQKIV